SRTFASSACWAWITSLWRAGRWWADGQLCQQDSESQGPCLNRRSNNRSERVKTPETGELVRQGGLAGRRMGSSRRCPEAGQDEGQHEAFVAGRRALELGVGGEERVEGAADVRGAKPAQAHEVLLEEVRAHANVARHLRLGHPPL